ncbi:MAG: CaiB/BaiF CoA transferase family protein [Burkholderiaceae bacterium]
MKTPLEGLRVLDFSHALAGPHCSTMLADYGADVLKLETPVTGDIARAWGAPLASGDNSYFISLHRNKRGLSINLKSDAGRQLCLSLMKNVDVVLENFRVGALQKLGLGYEAAKEQNPGIVYCSISGFGQDGPYRDRAALDLVVQAESGMISVTGEPDTVGARCGVSIADLTAGMYAAFGIMMGLRVKEQTGEGQYIDVSMLEGQLSLLSIMISSYEADGEVPGPMGTAYKALLPYQVFRTATQDLALAVGSEKLWKIFCPLIGHPELVEDPRFTSNKQRNANRAALVETLQNALLKHPFVHWEKTFLEAGIPMGAINTVDQVVHHPQVKARGAMVEMTHPSAGAVNMVNVPVKLSATPGSIRRPAPALGQHSGEILREVLNLPDSEIAALFDAGVVVGQR